MAGRGGTTPTKNSLNTPVPPPAKHEKTPQLLPLQTKIFQVPPFAIFLHFFSVPLVGGGAGGPCHVMHGMCSNFVDCEFFLESNSPDILALCETNLDDSIQIQKDSTTHMHDLAVYVKEEFPFAQDLSLNLSLTYVFDWLYFTIVFFFLY